MHYLIIELVANRSLSIVLVGHKKFRHDKCIFALKNSASILLDCATGMQNIHLECIVPNQKLSTQLANTFREKESRGEELKVVV